MLQTLSEDKHNPNKHKTPFIHKKTFSLTFPAFLVIPCSTKENTVKNTYAMDKCPTNNVARNNNVTISLYQCFLYRYEYVHPFLSLGPHMNYKANTI